MILILLQILVAVAAGDASEDGSGEISREESELGSGQLAREFSESPGGGGAVERQRNLNRIFDVLTEINPEALFEDYKYQDNNESSDLSNGNGDNDVASNSVEWKNASSESGNISNVQPTLVLQLTRSPHPSQHPTGHPQKLSYHSPTR